MPDLFKRLWESPTFTTWASLGTQSLSLVIILPLVLTRLGEAEIALYYLFASVITLQALFQLGFQPTFTRLIGYACGGRSVSEMWDLRDAKESTTKGSVAINYESLGMVCSGMRHINKWLSLWTLLLLALLGSWAMVKPIGLVADTDRAWLAWGIIVLVTVLRIHRNGYEAYLLGANHVALVRRWQALFSMGSIASLFLALTIFPDLLVLVAVHQIWIALGIVRGWQLSRYVSKGQFAGWSGSALDPFARKLAWSRAWRTGVGQVGSSATQQSLGIVYSQFGASASVASYLLGMRLVKVLEQFAMAPFYSKLPYLNKLRSAGEIDRLSRSAIRGIALAQWVYVLGAVGLAMTGPALLAVIGSNAQFPSPVLWYLLCFAFFFQRFGGNHIQLYSTTNHIIWHWANGIQGLVIIGISIALAGGFGDIGFALALLAGNLVYAVIAASFSYRILTEAPLQFELKTSAGPLLLLGLAAFLEWRWSASIRVSETVSQLVQL